MSTYQVYTTVIFFSNFVIVTININRQAIRIIKYALNYTPQEDTYCYFLCLPVYKSTFHSLKIGPKKLPSTYVHGSKTEIRKSRGQIFHLTMAYLKERLVILR